MPADGTVLVQAFDDWNENATWDTGEPGVAGLAFAYAGQDPGNSNVTGTLTTTAAGTATATLTIGAYGYNVTAPAGYSLMIPYGLSSQFTLTTGQTTTVGFPLIPIGTGTTATDADSPMVISQVYGSGGGTGSTYNRDFVELFNRGTASVDLSGWSVQYADTRSGSWQVIPLSGTLAAGRYYLIGGATGGTGAALPTVDASSTVNLATGAGKVVLDNTTTPLSGTTPNGTGLADLLGYGHADWYEGTGRAPGTTGGTATFRLGHGNYDTNDNPWDSLTAVVNPRNTASAAANRPPVVTVPGTRQTPINTSLTFSTATSSAITISDPDAGTSAVKVSVNSNHGTVTLAGTAGLTFTVGDGTADADMTFTGTLTNIATALNGLTFSPETAYRGYGGLTVWADDLGNTGAGGVLLDYGVAGVAVGGPVVSVADSAETAEDKAINIRVLDNDAWVVSTAPALSVQTQPAHGTAAVNNNGTPSDPADDFIVYTPAAEYHGADSFTYRLNDGLGGTDTATVSLAVAQVNDARIDTTGDPNMYSDEGASVSEQFNTPDATVAVTWSATGLPVGLSINTSTGMISGRAQYSQAGAHSFTLTATAASGDTQALNLVWNVTDVNRLAWKDDVFGVAGRPAATMGFPANDQIGNTLTYGATGLPPGVGFSPFPVPNLGGVPSVAGDYQVTLSVTGGGATDQRQFTWTVAASNYSGAQFMLNGTYMRKDDVGVIDTALPAVVQSYANLNPIKVEVKENDGGGNLVPSDMADLTADPETDPNGSNSLVVNPSSEGGSFYILPRLLSAATNDIYLIAYQWFGSTWIQVGQAQLNNAKFLIGTGLTADGKPDHTRDRKVDAKTTPDKMFQASQFRIPPRAWDKTDLWVTLDGKIGEDKHFYLLAPRKGTDVKGQSDANGRVALRIGAAGNGAHRVELTDGIFQAIAGTAQRMANIGIRGHLKANGDPYQTETGNAGKLWLGVFTHWEDMETPSGEGRGPMPVNDAVADTLGFSVAAIPIRVVNYGMEKSKAKVGAQDFWGLKVQVGITPDSDLGDGKSYGSSGNCVGEF